MTNTETQRAFKARMYEAGYKQSIVWVARDPDAGSRKITRAAFIRKMDKLTGGWSPDMLSRLFNTVLSMIEAKGVRSGKRKK
jgi:hypothetical protein